MKTMLCIVMTILFLSTNPQTSHYGEVESMIRVHIEKCAADGLSIPAVEVSAELFSRLVDEVGWERVFGSHGQRRWIVFKTPDSTRKSGKRYFRVEQYPTPES